MKNKNVSQLEKLVKDFKKDLSNLRIEMSLGSLKNPHQLKSKKKDIARVMTFLKIKSSAQVEVKKTEKAKE